MARRFSGFRARMVRSGRKTFWIGGVGSIFTLAAASTAIAISSLNAAALALAPFTIVRTRGWFAFGSDQIAADETQIVHYGEILVTEQALAIGVTAVPTPATDNGSSWHVYESAGQRFEFVSNAGVQPDMFPHRYEFDSKAMRKFDEGDQLIQVAETDASSGGALIATFSRLLIKLH